MRQVRASYNKATIRVYQAYGPEIAVKALRAQTFVPPFKMDRMTWIKPSFLWMMYRSGWGTKEGQERVLAIDIDRSGFEWALAHSCLSHFDPALHASREEWLAAKEASCVRVQFDPDRGPSMEMLDTRAIQIGLSGEAVKRYVNDWIKQITDITTLAREIHELVEAGKTIQCGPLLPRETEYPLPPNLLSRLGLSGPDWKSLSPREA